MCISVFSATATTVYAMGNAQKLFSVKDGYVKDKIITYTINMASGIEGIGGAVVLVEFDSTVLKPVDCEPATNSSGAQQFKGVYQHGLVKDTDNVYSIAYINSSPVKTTTVTPFFTMRFEVVDDNRPSTSLAFYCKEFYSTTDSEQNITVSDGLQLIKEIPDVPTLEAPKLKGAKLGTNKITLSWDAADGANGYVIRRECEDSGREIIAEVSADVLEYVDVSELISGKTYTYFVQSVNGDATSAYNSNGVSCKYVSKPENIAAANSVGGIEITWDKAAGADNYVIMRREAGAEQWTKLVTRSAASTTLYKDTKVENGKTYEYDVNSAVGSFTTDTAEQGVMISYLETPSVLSVSNTENGIELTWKELENASYYVVYRRAVGTDTDFKEYETVTTNTFVDSLVTDGKAYTYTVKAVNDYGESAVTKTGYTITRVPSAIVSSMATGADNVTVFWESVNGVNGYYVYRRTEASAWEKVGSVRSTADYYKDTSVISGNEYYYAVAPYIGNSEGARVSSAEKVYYLAAPKPVVDNNKAGIKVIWEAVGDAQHYELMRRVGENGQFEFVKTVKKGEPLEYIDTDVTEGSVYFYVLKAYSLKGESRNSDIQQGTMRIACVENVSVKMLSDSVKITWRVHRSADSYIVCRNDGNGWVELAGVEDTSYVDDTVASGNEYKYAIKPVLSGFKGGVSEDEVVSVSFLASPVLKAENKSASTLLSWKSVGGADKYEIRRAKVGSGGKVGEYTVIATVSYKVTSFEDTEVSAGTRYRYIIRSIDGSLKSANSDYCENVFMKAPSISKVSNAYGGVKISWGSVKGANKYRVYRKLTGEKSWTKLGTVSSESLSYLDKTAKNNVNATYAVRAENGKSLSTYQTKSIKYFAAPTVTLKNSGSAISVSWNSIPGAKSYYVYRKGPGDSSWKRVGIASKTSYTDKNVTAGKKYTYTVKSYNGKEFSSYKSSGWSIIRLTTPKLTKAVNNAGSITVSWGKVSGAKTYNVYRKLKGDDSWTKIATGVKSTSYTDKKVSDGKTYIYTVKAVNSSSTSAHSSTGITIKRLGVPELVSAVSSKSGITVRWEAEKGASGYYVYRRVGSGAWERIAKVSGKDTVKYVDKTAKKGVTYTYTVKAYSGSYTGKTESGIKCKDKY